MTVKLLALALLSFIVTSQSLEYTGGVISNELLICNDAAQHIRLFEDPLFKNLRVVSCDTQIASGVNLILGLAKADEKEAICELNIFVFTDGEHLPLKTTSENDCFKVLAVPAQAQ